MRHQHETGNRTGNHLTYACKYGESRVSKPLYHESYDIHKSQEYVECGVDNYEFIYVADKLNLFLLYKEKCKLLSDTMEKARATRAYMIPILIQALSP